MGKRINNIPLGRQINLLYTFFFCMIFGVCAVLYIGFILNTVQDSEEAIIDYTLSVTENRMISLIENANDFSKIAESGKLVQNILSKGRGSSYGDQVELQNEMKRIAACCDGISSVFIFDKNGNLYYGGNIYEVETIQSRIEDVLTEMQEENDRGKAEVLPISRTRMTDGEQMIFYARTVKNLDTLENIGTIALSIPMQKITDTYDSVSRQNGVEMALIDENGDVLSATQEGQWLADSSIVQKIPGLQKGVLHRNNVRYYVSMRECGETGITAIAALERSVILGTYGGYWTVTVIIFIIGTIGVVSAAAFITNRINRPLHRILKSMDQVEKGNFDRIETVETNAEMNELQARYNQMLLSTERLMTQRVKEQRIRRKYELSLLQAQIKPHFLYNTFDSVCALAMMGRNEDVYNMMQALGQYYRNSLHKGQEIITVEEELDIVRNYLIIESYRFEDTFKAEFDVDESVKKYHMVKLVLQPLVENALYHGFRDYELTGTITISAKDDGYFVKLQVQDDGYGMTEERLQQVMDDDPDNASRRFGLYGTLSRIRLYYQDVSNGKQLIDIQSELGEGTTITVWIPKDGGEDHVESSGS